MLIEWLKFKVPEQWRGRFVQKEAEIWTPVVANNPAFVSQEICINPQESNELYELVESRKYQVRQFVRSCSDA